MHVALSSNLGVSVEDSPGRHVSDARLMALQFDVKQRASVPIIVEEAPAPGEAKVARVRR